ncbi:hypothetical protein D0Y65_022739 [Glycine soja]|uniref:Uncharacterized protein n=1 Tax=Glycine soja TaxID=3848 RepID=A0A445JQ04_GLYSO|nr:hypothetical protein D0Y65_022739 [Glycine soja]
MIEQMNKISPHMQTLSRNYCKDKIYHELKLGNSELKLGIPLSAPLSSSTTTILLVVLLPIHHSHHHIINSPAPQQNMKTLKPLTQNKQQIQ